MRRSTYYLDLHQFLKSDPIKKLEPEAKYKSIREHFSEHWGRPHSFLDITKIKQELTEMQGDDPGWRKFLQNFNYFVGSLEQTMQRDAVIYGPVPAVIYPGCKTSSNCASRTAPGFYRSVPSSRR